VLTAAIAAIEQAECELAHIRFSAQRAFPRFVKEVAMSAKERVPTWLYHRQHGARMHELAPGSPLPTGWRDTPWPDEEAIEAARSKIIGIPATGAERSRVRRLGRQQKNRPD
jgi:hypothetical protein